MLTPWGESQYTKQLAPGVYLVSTAGHGGILIGRSQAKKLLSRKAIVIGMLWGNFLAYEEDCDIAAVWYEHPEFASSDDKSKIKRMAQESLQRWHPAYFIAK
jgi:hypothetical protein